jgi:hypothetical protein
MMTEFDRDELKDIVLDSYRLLVTLPEPSDKNPRKKWEISSRNKLKILPEALREFEDPSASITHFVKSASYSLPRAERGTGADISLNNLLTSLLDMVAVYSKKKDNPEHLRQKLVYLIGYLNWGSDSICVLMTESKDPHEFNERLKAMLKAEFTIIGAESEVERIANAIMQWALPSVKG